MSGTNKNKALLGGAAVLLAGCLSAAPAMADSAPSVSVEEAIPAFATPRSQADVVPADINLSSLGNIDADTVHRLGEDSDATYWVARNGSANVCLIIVVTSASQTAAAGCADITQFYQHGLALRAFNSDTSAEATLIPADVSASQIPALANLPQTFSDQGLFIGPVGDVDGGVVVVHRDSGIDFTFAPLTGEMS